MRFADIEEARAAPGLRLVIAGNIPSPWSQAAMGIFDLKGIDYAAVRFRPAAEAVRVWTGAHNVPVAVYDAEPPRTGWAEILTLGERLGGRMSLLPDSDGARVQTFGLAHELLGEGGLGWSVRLLLVHASVTTDGREGWPAKVASYLAPKYGYAPERVAGAQAHAIRVLGLLGRSLETSQRAGHLRRHRPQRRGDFAARRLPHARAGPARARDARQDRSRRGPHRSTSASGPDVRTAPAGSAAVLSYVTSLRPMMDPMSVVRNATRQNVVGSWKNSIPTAAVPKAPIPVQTA
jgi:hypothetical protein